MALRPQNPFDAPSGPASGDEPDALQPLAQRAEAMATEGLSDAERRGLGHLNAGRPKGARQSRRNGILEVRTKRADAA